MDKIKFQEAFLDFLKHQPDTIEVLPMLSEFLHQLNLKTVHWLIASVNTDTKRFSLGRDTTETMERLLISKIIKNIKL